MSRQGKSTSDKFVAAQQPFNLTKWGWHATHRWWPTLGCPSDTVFIERECPEQRAYRRFPINSHKPGGWQ
jgi:hypothetical protein